MPTAAGESRNWLRGPCWPRCGRNSRRYCNRLAVNTRAPVSCCPLSRSRPATASRSVCCSTRTTRWGLAAIGQVNLGVRKHRNRPLADLGVMSRQIIGTMLRRCGIEDSGAGLTQFLVDGDSFVPETTEVSLLDRPPPMNSIVRTAGGLTAHTRVWEYRSMMTILLYLIVMALVAR